MTIPAQTAKPGAKGRSQNAASVSRHFVPVLDTQQFYRSMSSDREKPNIPHQTMVALTLMHAPNQKATLNMIVKYIMQVRSLKQSFTLKIWTDTWAVIYYIFSCESIAHPMCKWSMAIKCH